MRTYTKVGNTYPQEEIDKSIGLTILEEFRTKELPFMQGECLKKVIQECKIPLKAIKKMCLHNIINLYGEDHGFYGLDVTYKNGQAQLYIADDGCEACVVASDFESKGGN